jgi:hypothetical protein
MYFTATGSCLDDGMMLPAKGVRVMVLPSAEV